MMQEPIQHGCSERRVARNPVLWLGADFLSSATDWLRLDFSFWRNLGLPSVMFNSEQIDQLNTRQMQLLAAVFLDRYCKQLDLRSRPIEELIYHLCSLCSARDLPAWEGQGTLLAVTGRGDPLPNEVTSAIPAKRLLQFRTLVDHAVEVGLADMYGPCTDAPKAMLMVCISVLQQAQIRPPEIGRIIGIGQGGSGWGPPIDHEELLKIMSFYEIGDCPPVG